ncbi:hypothetical protein [Paracoccus sp. AK26]|uniref:hypothetical protein n=1 Tax=Paracoccus sp. AK26 TaxID=2589076 RepID=UPI001430F7D1|nr:hypothetical protein [Paracoccus sp. AK26]
MRADPLRRPHQQYNVKSFMPVWDPFGIMVVDARTFLPVETAAPSGAVLFCDKPIHLDS